MKKPHPLMAGQPLWRRAAIAGAGFTPARPFETDRRAERTSRSQLLVDQEGECRHAAGQAPLIGFMEPTERAVLGDIRARDRAASERGFPLAVSGGDVAVV